MFKRKITGSIQRWKDSPRRKCLLVVGARGVGKTSVIRDFIEHNYESSLTIDLMADTDLHRAFNGDLNADSILSRIRAMRPDIDPVPGRTVIFLDGIQACPYARMSLKYLVEDGGSISLPRGPFWDSSIRMPPNARMRMRPTYTTHLSGMSAS